MDNDTGKKRGTLYGIGIGPGDPDLLTVKGMRILRTVKTVFLPAGKLQNGSLAKTILARGGYVPEEGVSGPPSTIWRELSFPMSGDEKELEAHWKQAADTVAESLQNGEDAAFATLGDPSVYSTWVYLSRELANVRPEIACVPVPGIQTMNAAAAALNIPLVCGKERLALLPLPDTDEEVRNLAEMFDTLVFYKIGERLERLRMLLEELGLSESSYFARRVGLPEELLAAGMGNIPPETTGYLSTLIVHTGRST